MQKFIVNGGKKICGDVTIQGAKNAVLPILAATTLVTGDVVLHNCPRLSDTYSALQILTSLGCDAKFDEVSKNTIIVNSDDICSCEISEDLMQKMRSSIFFLGALIGRLGRCTITFPGGCDIGQRPIDIHLSALKKLGSSVKDDHGYLEFCVNGRLSGSKITLSFPSVGATENIILAAVLADGVTEICNAAREPEIVDLAEFLLKCGAKIHGAGTDKIKICGVKKLHGCEYEIMSDRIVAATYLSCAAITSGELILRKCCNGHLEAVTSLFEQMGCTLHYGDNAVYFSARKKLRSLETVRTLVYPGFPTDCQALIMADMAVANGTTIFVENIFENRFLHAGSLNRMGADIKTEGRVAVVEGVGRLYGANVTAPDLRGGAGILAAALAAEGKTEISGIHHIDRGYENIEEVLNLLGADIKRR